MPGIHNVVVDIVRIGNHLSFFHDVFFHDFPVEATVFGSTHVVLGLLAHYFSAVLVIVSLAVTGKVDGLALAVRSRDTSLVEVLFTEVQIESIGVEEAIITFFNGVLYLISILE